MKKNHRKISELKAYAQVKLNGNYPKLILTFFVMSVICLVMWYILSIFKVSFTNLLQAGLAIYKNEIEDYNTVCYIISYSIDCIFSIIESFLVGPLIFGESLLYLKLSCGQDIKLANLFFPLKSDAVKTIKFSFILSLINFVCMLPSYIFDLYNPIQSENILQNAYSAELISSIDMHTLIMQLAVNTCCLVLSLWVNYSLSQVYFLYFDFPNMSIVEIIKLSISKMKGNKLRLLGLYLSFIPLYILGILTLFIGFLWIEPYLKATKAEFFLDLMKEGQNSESNINEATTI